MGLGKVVSLTAAQKRDEEFRQANKSAQPEDRLFPDFNHLDVRFSYIGTVSLLEMDLWCFHFCRPNCPIVCYYQ